MTNVEQQQWDIIDALEEPGHEVDAHMLSAAYEKLAELYTERGQKTWAKMATGNAMRILRSKSSTEIPILVFQFFIDYLKDREDVDKEAVSAAYTRLADIQEELGTFDPKRLTPRYILISIPTPV